MPHPAVLDFDALLAPISEESPCGTDKDGGIDPTLGNLFSNLVGMVSTAKKIEARRQELESLSLSQRQETISSLEGMSDSPMADPKWSSIVEQACEVLSKHSKDTRILLYLSEALPRVERVPGLRDVLQLNQLMLEKYGDQLFPKSDVPEEHNYYLQFVARVNESSNVLAAIERMPFRPDEPRLHYQSHLQAMALEQQSAEQREEAIKAGEVSLNDFAGALGRSTAEELDDFSEQIQEAISAAEKLDAVLGALSGKEYLGVGNVIETLKKVQRWYAALVETRLVALRGSSPQPASAGPDGGLSVPAALQGMPVNVLAGSLQSREQALSSLLKVADFFRQTEPHSPLSYALEQAVRWGRMPLPDLLRELVPDPTVLEEVYKRTGIQGKSEES